MSAGESDRTYRKLKDATWNFSPLCSEHKQKEIAELLTGYLCSGWE